MDKTVVIAGVFVGCLAVAGCSPTGAGPIPNDCGAAALQDRIGQPVTGTAAQDLRVGGQPVATGGLVRVVGVGQPRTEDYREDRLTIETDQNGNLATAQCI